MLTGPGLVQSHGALCFERPRPGLVLCHHHHEICYKFWTNSPAFQLRLGLTNDVAVLGWGPSYSSEQGSLSQKKAEEPAKLWPWRKAPSMKSVPVNFTPYSPLFVISQAHRPVWTLSWAESPCTQVLAMLLKSNRPLALQLSKVVSVLLDRIHLIYIYICKPPHYI